MGYDVYDYECVWISMMKLESQLKIWLHVLVDFFSLLVPLKFESPTCGKQLIIAMNQC
jgi:hypothetical protein